MWNKQKKTEHYIKKQNPQRQFIQYCSSINDIESYGTKRCELIAMILQTVFQLEKIAGFSRFAKSSRPAS